MMSSLIFVVNNNIISRSIMYVLSILIRYIDDNTQLIMRWHYFILTYSNMSQNQSRGATSFQRRGVQLDRSTQFGAVGYIITLYSATMQTQLYASRLFWKPIQRCWLQGRHHVFIVEVQFLGLGYYYPSTEKNRQVYPFWCSWLHNHTLFIKKLCKKLGGPDPPTPLWLQPCSEQRHLLMFVLHSVCSMLKCHIIVISRTRTCAPHSNQPPQHPHPRPAALRTT